MIVSFSTQADASLLLSGAGAKLFLYRVNIARQPSSFPGRDCPAINDATWASPGKRVKGILEVDAIP